MFLAVLTLITALSISAVNINKLDIVTISVNENTIAIIRLYFSARNASKINMKQNMIEIERILSIVSNNEAR